MSPGLELGAVLWGFALFGFAGSLHCVGMCGPILLSFARPLQGSGHWISFAGYQAGRMWTYALLGGIAGWAGGKWQEGAALLGWQRPLAVVAALALLGLGIWSARGGLSGRWLAGCRARLGGGLLPDLGAWFRDPRAAARLLVGALMGFLPCGLVYGALAMAAMLGDPLRGALGLFGLGLGTLPALALVSWGAPRIPSGLRRLAGQLHVYLFVSLGVLLLARALLVAPGAHGH